MPKALVFFFLIVSIAQNSCLGSNMFGGSSVIDNLKQVPFEESKSEDPAPPPPPGDIGFFPYDIKWDTIAFLPCESSRFRVLRAGAYFSRSGIRLSDYYLNKYKSKNIDIISPILQKTHYFKSFPLANIVGKNKFLKELISVLESTKELESLYLEREHEKIIRTGRKRLKTLNNNPIKEEFFFRDNYWSPKRLFNAPNFGGLSIALYYKTRDKKAIAWKNKDSTSNSLFDFYGRVYDLEFDNLGSLHSSLSQRFALKAIQETKPLDSQDRGNWECPESLRLEVRRHPSFSYKKELAFESIKERGARSIKNKSKNQLTEKGYLFSDESLCQNSSEGGNKLRIAKALLGDSWNINISQKCISPKNSSLRCYPNLGTANEQVDRLMNINNNEICNPNKGHSNNYQNNAFRAGESAKSKTIRKTFACPYFLSICIRKGP